MAAKERHRVALGRAVRELRSERSWTQERLAHESGLHWTYIGGIERGERNPTWDNVVRLAKALRVKVSDLVLRAERHMAK
jgi:transcriptional regulator with XRE-family HTH domain